MKVPPEVTFRDVPHNETIAELIDQKIKKLNEVCDHITTCRVAVEKPHKHKHHGNAFRVRIVVHIPPGHEIVVIEEPTHGDGHETLKTVVTQAFNVLLRRVKKVVECQKEHGKVSIKETLANSEERSSEEWISN
ncbi:MAG: HPF/RaiA family ribosome-associated protein [Candidatus Omnitrophica bacterium]|nr:HPF/RaiA family ribosome-associated protein [Candidatus Omnitrophota bacterium]